MQPRRAVFLLSATTLLFHTALAQEYTKAEIGAQTSVLFQNRLGSLTDVGVGGRFTYNFTPSIALESEVNGYFTNIQSPPSTQDGGRALVGLIGPKAGIRRDKFGVFFKARGGVMSFSNAFTSAAALTDPTSTARKTHAVLDLGTAAEFYPSSRTIIRFDIGRMLVRYGDATLATFPDGGTFVSRGDILGPWHMEIGTSYRLGTLHEDRETSPTQQRFETGIQYSLFSSIRGFQEFVRDESGVGGWFTWNFSKYVGLDGSTTFFPRTIHVADFQQGGTMFQTLVGIRAGIRRGHFGIFGKFRPGIQRYSATEANPAPFGVAPFTDIALDAGGIIEFYGARHSIFRFDAGDTQIHYRARDFAFADGPFHASAFTNNTIQLSVGFGFRF